MYLTPPMGYLFGDLDKQAFHDLLVRLEREDDEFCKSVAEEYFKQHDIDMAVYIIIYASIKSPQRKNFYRVYSTAYIIHKIAMKVNNWYAVLGIKDLNADVEEIRKNYNNLVTLMKICSSVAAESALRLIDTAWAVLSHPRLREAYDKQLFSASSQFHEYVASSSAYSEVRSSTT